VKIYLDLCAIQRPLDTPNQVRIVLEAEAILGIIALCGSEQAELLSSEALQYEGEQSSMPIRREHTFAVLAETGNADYFCTCDDRLTRNTKQIKDLMVKIINPVDLIQEIEK